MLVEIWVGLIGCGYAASIGIRKAVKGKRNLMTKDETSSATE